MGRLKKSKSSPHRVVNGRNNQYQSNNSRLPGRRTLQSILRGMYRGLPKCSIGLSRTMKVSYGGQLVFAQGSFTRPIYLGEDTHYTNEWEDWVS